jgi:pyruvate dehydrogenase E2 component (dihydrolipoamide acetyltransferase)
VATNVIMPALGAAMKSGRLIRWYKQAGDAVTQGEPLMEVETDKVTLDIEAPAAGTLAQVTAADGDDVPVGQVVAVILAAGEQPAAAVAAAAPSGPAPVTAAPAPAGNDQMRRPPASPLATSIAAEFGVDLSAVKPVGSRIVKDDVLAHLDSRRSGRVQASPKARRLAAEHQIDLQQLNGSGPDGAVLAADVLQAAARAAAAPVAATPAPAVPAPAPQPEPAAGQTLSMSNAWQIMAQRTTASWQEAPHFFLSREVDAGALQAWRNRAKGRIDGLTVSDLLVYLIARTLRDHPRVNAAWLNNQIVLNQHVNVGLAVALDDGLLVPVLHDADRMSLKEITSRRAQIVEAAKKGKLSYNDMRDCTFSVSNLGMFNVDAFHAILNPPQAAILAVGRIAERVTAVNGQVQIRPTMILTLTCDHRVLDGARGARFLDQLARMIEDPLASLD